MKAFAPPTLVIVIACGSPAAVPGSPGNMGPGDSGGPDTPAGGTAAIQVVADTQNACALLAGGGAICWGYNSDGEIGDGTSGADAARPAPVSGLRGAIKIAAGGQVACAVLGDGSVACWGQAGQGLPGGTTPQRFSGVSQVAELAIGFDEACARLATGTVECWGPTGPAPQPTPIQGLQDVAQISVGNGTACAVSRGGGVACWSGADAVATPVALTQTTQVSVGTSGFACAARSDGTVWCWGRNTDGELGDGTTVDRASPVQAAGVQGAAGVSAGDFTACAWTTAGGALCWGDNHDGTVGDGTFVSRLTPTPVEAVSRVKSVAVGGGHACALLTDGAVRCWGDDGSGQLGDGGALGRSSAPVGVSL